MYSCDGCGNTVKAKSGDPIHVTSAGKFCTNCHKNNLNAPAPVIAAPRNNERGERMRAQWAAMTDEQKKAHVERMQAARRHRRAPTETETEHP